MRKYHDIIYMLTKATGADRELDAVIWMLTTAGATRASFLVKSETNRWPPYTIDETRDADGRLIIVPSFTSSIDAAIALVERMLPGWRWLIRPDKDGAFANLYPTPLWLAPEADWQEGRNCFPTIAQTPPFAILIALFRALQAKEESE